MQLMTITNRGMIQKPKSLGDRRHKKSEKKSNSGFKNLTEFTDLLRAEFEGFIDAEYEDLEDETDKEHKSYKDVLFPKFLLKCCYVNYYA